MWQSIDININDPIKSSYDRQQVLAINLYVDHNVKTNALTYIVCTQFIQLSQRDKHFDVRDRVNINNCAQPQRSTKLDHN